MNDANDQAQLKNMVDRANETLKKCENNDELDHKEKRTFILDTGIYNSETNSFTCPDGYEVVYKHKDNSHGHAVYKYKCAGFDACENREQCTKSKSGREIN